jgi:general secretion pathway protein I
LIEALVALALVTILLSSIGALIATTVHGSRTIEAALARLETARAVFAGLPDRDQLKLGSLSGELANHKWRVDVSPLATFDPRHPRPWMPLSVTVTVRSRAGAPLELQTVRLRPSIR